MFLLGFNLSWNKVADMHYANGMMSRCRDVLKSEFPYCSDLNTTRFLKRMLEAEKPDFIAFTGLSSFYSSTAFIYYRSSVEFT